MKLVWGREPAAWVALFTAALGSLTAFGFSVDANLQALLIAGVSAVLGLVVAIQVHDGIVAAVTGLAQALVSLVVGLGLDWSTEDQMKIMYLVIAAVAWYTRKNVSAPVAPAASPAGVLVAKKGADGVHAVQ